MSTLEKVKQLRQQTSAGMNACSAALKEADGDLEKAVEILRKKGIAKAAKKATRAAEQGVVESYIHPGDRVGVLLEVNCETDFVARNEDFRQMTKDIAMQIAASHPLYVQREDVPEDLISKEKEIFASQMKDKPKDVLDKILEGKIDKFYGEICLLEQPFIKDPDKTVQDLVTGVIATLGENIVIKRFARFAIGEEA
ncbi:MAG: translation elongation factor Ts [Candidatus Omnitrophica bacterium]|nr:translation elongation factor Ts [Candidatus Omnitrophota bacterium]